MKTPKCWMLCYVSENDLKRYRAKPPGETVCGTSSTWLRGGISWRRPQDYHRLRLFIALARSRSVCQQPQCWEVISRKKDLVREGKKRAKSICEGRNRERTPSLSMWSIGKINGVNGIFFAVRDLLVCWDKIESTFKLDNQQTSQYVAVVQYPTAI